MAVLDLSQASMSQFPPIIREFATYKSAIEGCSTKTVCEYLSDLRTFFRFLEAQRTGAPTDEKSLTEINISDIPEKRILAVRPEDIYSFILFAGNERQNGWASRARKLSAVKALYRYLSVKKHSIEKNPTADIDAPKRRATLPKFLTLEESTELLQAVKNDTDSKHTVRDFAILVLFLNCGMRLSELVGINLTDFDRELRTLRIRGKGAKERMVYLNDACRRAVVDYINDRQLTDPANVTTTALFLGRSGQRISNKTVQWIVYKYLDRAGLGGRGFSVHKLRHTAATLMYRNGNVDVRVLKDILGHEQLNTTQIYTHVSDEGMAAAADANPLARLNLDKK